MDNHHQFVLSSTTTNNGRPSDFRSCTMVHAVTIDPEPDIYENNTHFDVFDLGFTDTLMDATNSTAVVTTNLCNPTSTTTNTTPPLFIDNSKTSNDQYDFDGINKINNGAAVAAYLVPDYGDSSLDANCDNNIFAGTESTIIHGRGTQGSVSSMLSVSTNGSIISNNSNNIVNMPAPHSIDLNYIPTWTSQNQMFQQNDGFITTNTSSNQRIVTNNISNLQYNDNRRYNESGLDFAYSTTLQGSDLVIKNGVSASVDNDITGNPLFLNGNYQDDFPIVNSLQNVFDDEDMFLTISNRITNSCTALPEAPIRKQREQSSISQFLESRNTIHSEILLNQQQPIIATQPSNGHDLYDFHNDTEVQQTIDHNPLNNLPSFTSKPKEEFSNPVTQYLSSNPLTTAISSSLSGPSLEPSVSPGRRAIVCRICGKGEIDETDGMIRPMVRFAPVEYDIAAFDVPSVPTFQDEIWLHVFCGKTASILPSVNRPDLEILSKSGIKNKHGIGDDVDKALARTRCAVIAHEIISACSIKGIYINKKEMQFYLVCEFEALLATVRNRDVSYRTGFPSGSVLTSNRQSITDGFPQQCATLSIMAASDNTLRKSTYPPVTQLVKPLLFAVGDSSLQQQQKSTNASKRKLFTETENPSGRTKTNDNNQSSEQSEGDDSTVDGIIKAQHDNTVKAVPAGESDRNTNPPMMLMLHSSKKQIRCPCGGLYQPGDDSTTSIAGRSKNSWQNHLATVGHQKWMEENSATYAV